MPEKHKQNITSFKICESITHSYGISLNILRDHFNEGIDHPCVLLSFLPPNKNLKERTFLKSDP